MDYKQVFNCMPYYGLAYNRDIGGYFIEMRDRISRQSNLTFNDYHTVDTSVITYINYKKEISRGIRAHYNRVNIYG